MTASYKEGDKFIIEIEDTVYTDNKDLHIIKGFNALVFDDNGLDKLEKVEPHDTYAESYNEGIIEGRNEAWEAVKKVTDMNQNERLKVFGASTMTSILAFNTMTELFDKLAAYEAKKKAEEEEINVGDEIIISDQRRVVTRVYDNGDMVTLNECGMPDVLYNRRSRVVEKTGRHFDQIEELLTVLNADHN